MGSCLSFILAFSDIYILLNLKWFISHRLSLDFSVFVFLLAWFWSLGFVWFLAVFGLVGVLVRGSVVLSVRVSVLSILGSALLRTCSPQSLYLHSSSFRLLILGGFPPFDLLLAP